MTLQVPFATGVVASFVFLIFELIILPILLRATTAIASISVYRRCMNGADITIRSESVPLLNDGLLYQQRVHMILLLLRALAVCLPVYLETTLESVNVPVMEVLSLPHAYSVNPRGDSYQYWNESKISGFDLVQQSKRSFDNCAVAQDDGWIVARAASVMLNAEGAAFVGSECIAGSEQKIYQKISGLPPHVNDTDLGAPGPRHTSVFKINITWEYGMLSDFPDSLERDAFLGSITFDIDDIPVYRIRDVTLLEKNSGLQCFIQSEFKIRKTPDTPAILFNEPTNPSAFFISCQNVTGLSADYFINTAQHEIKWIGEYPANAGSDVRKSFGELEVEMYLVGRLRFANRLLITANMFFVNNAYVRVESQNDLNEVLRSVIYSYKANTVVKRKSGEFKAKTEIFNYVIVLAVLELAIVVGAGILILTLSHRIYGSIPIINTVNGMSACWAAVTNGDGLQNYSNNVRNRRVYVFYSKKSGLKHTLSPSLNP